MFDPFKQAKSNLRNFTPAGQFGLYGEDGKDSGISYESAANRRKDAYNYGRELGQKEFYDDPDMSRIRATREDLAKGLSATEFDAMRAEAKAGAQAQQSNYLKSLQSNLAKSGVGGARSAAIRGQAEQGFAKQGADAERKLLLDSAQMKRQGISDLQDYLMRQKLGALGLAYGQQSLSSADYAAEKGVQAAQAGGKK